MDDAISLLREARAYLCDPAGMTPEIVQDNEAFANFFAELDAKKESLIARIDALLAKPAQADEPPIAFIGVRLSADGKLLNHSTLKHNKYELVDLGYLEAEITPLGRMDARPVAAQEDGK